MFRPGDLGAVCKGDGRYDFMFVARALSLAGGVASPIRPLAIK